ncbi:hypothetical protein HPB50_012205 [Hyalomma asiaticum]|uniref:Uncharacterized protein n=1 Tax=Hyalomma asiaticum TaxID=266040 RepID=A0ACB7SPL8_HYAAI|nr:hypothetical protein HPB50_012205 [Hyalomma asiaticum]
MDVTVEGYTITAEEFQAGHWTPVLHKAYASRPASLAKPLHYPIDTSEANPDAKDAARVAAAATGGGKTPVRLPLVTKDARLAAQHSKQLPPLPPNAIRVVVRPRCEIRLREVPTPRLIKAVQAALRIALAEDFCLRIHPTNNTFTAATTHSPIAETLKTLTSLTIGGHTYLCVAYVAPPPGATRGVISNAATTRPLRSCTKTCRPSNHRRSSENRLHTYTTYTTFPNCLRGLPSLPNTSKHGPCQEVAAAKAEAQAARAEAAALREHIAKLEAQISTHATALPAPPTPTPNASQAPPPNPPTAPVLPNHLNPDIYANSLELDADAELPQQSTAFQIATSPQVGASPKQPMGRAALQSLSPITILALRLRPFTSNEQLLKLGVHNTFEELSEATFTAQKSRLSNSVAGRTLLSKSNLTTITRSPESMHPERDEKRTKARARALQKQYGEDHGVVYVDVAA